MVRKHAPWGCSQPLETSTSAKTMVEIDVEENKRKLWLVLFGEELPAKKRSNIMQNAGIVSKLVGRDFKEEEVQDFLESED